MLPEEQAENSRYFYELASGKFGWSLDKVRPENDGWRAGLPLQTRAGRQDRHGWPPAGDQGEGQDRGGARARTGTGRDLAVDVRGPRPARTTTAGSPTRCGRRPAAFPIGVKLSAQHVEDDIDAALRVGVDYIILDGRGGGTGAAPVVFRDHISVPTIPALARARRHLDARGRQRHHPRDHRRFADPHRLRQGARPRGRRRRGVELGDAGDRLHRHAGVLARTTARSASRRRSPNCGSGCRWTRPPSDCTASSRPVDGADGRARPGVRPHPSPASSASDDLTTFDREMAHLTGITYGGVSL